MSDHTCSKCIYSDKYPGITFDENRVCNVCTSSKRKWEKKDFKLSEKKLLEIFRKEKANKNKYDCIVGFSGGKDSTYTLWLCKNKYKLNPLAVNFDNGFQSEDCRKRIQIITQKLKVDLYVHKPDWKIMQRIYRLFLFKAKEFCSPCNFGIYSTLYRVGLEKKIPLIILGFSQKFEATPLLKNRRFCGDDLINNVIQGEMNYSEYSQFLIKPYLKKMNFIPVCLPYYINWDKHEILKTVEKEFNWTKEYFYTAHPDCLAFPISSLIKEKKFGFGRYTDELAADARYLFISRKDAAIKAKKQEKENRKAELEYFLKKLEIKNLPEFSNINDRTRLLLTKREDNSAFDRINILISKTNNLKEKVELIINELVRPDLVRDGGDISLVKIQDNVVYLKLLGICVGCPISQVILHDFIESLLMKYLKEIREMIWI